MTSGAAHGSGGCRAWKVKRLLGQNGAGILELMGGEQWEFCVGLFRQKVIFQYGMKGVQRRRKLEKVKKNWLSW